MLNTLVQSGNLLRHISSDSCQGECLFLILERYTRFALLNNHTFIAPIGVLLSSWLHFQHWCQKVAHFKWFFWCQPYNYSRQHLFQSQRANYFTFLFHVNSASLNNDGYKCPNCWYPECLCLWAQQALFIMTIFRGNAALHTQIYCVMVLIIFR